MKLALVSRSPPAYPRVARLHREPTPIETASDRARVFARTLEGTRAQHKLVAPTGLDVLLAFLFGFTVALAWGLL